ncbi:MAG: diguanylate cyclase [Kofleriaceae bacterium]
MGAPKPPNEAQRLAALQAFNILDTAPQPSFDRITALVARILEVPIALVSLVDDERQWFKSCVGLGASETSRDVAFCAYAILNPGVLVVPDAAEDPRFADNPLVTGEPYIRSYAGAPLVTKGGYALGTLCAIDTRPRKLTPDQLQTLVDLAAIVVDEIELDRLAREMKVFEKISNLSPNVVYMMDLPNLRVSWRSKKMRELLGFELGDLREAGLRQHMPPADAKRAADNIVRAQGLPDGEIHETSYSVLDAMGNERHMLVRSTPFARETNGRLTEVLSIATDITPLKTAQRRVLESEQALAGRVEVLEAILETAGEGILVADENAQVIVANPLARQVTGRMPGDEISVERNPRIASGFFESDGVTPIEMDRLPLRNALRGISTNNVEMMVRNDRFPEGMHLMATGRPVLDRDGHVRGGVVTLSDVTALRNVQHRLAELAITDELTQLPNRRALRDRLDLLSAEAARGRRFSVAIVDIDHFKKVNDTHGHGVGDQVLVAVARTLKDSIRRSDMVARMGGEEFCVIQTDIDDELMKVLTERLRAAIEGITDPLTVTASFGVCHSGKTHEPTALLHHADEALYTAKREGRNRVIVAP